MKKRLLKAVSLGVLLSALSGSIVNATEQYAMPDESYIEMPHDGNVVEVEIFSEEEMLAMCSLSDADIASLATTVEPDPYEPNNTRDTAYPYDKTEKLTGNVFIDGYRNSNCHVEGDEDFFSISLSTYYTYDVVLKNLYRQDRHIYIWESNGDGTWSRYKYKYQQTGQPEHWTFTPARSGTHYVQIAGVGVESFYYFFAVERLGTINTALWPSEVL